MTKSIQQVNNKANLQNLFYLAIKVFYDTFFKLSKILLLKQKTRALFFAILSFFFYFSTKNIIKAYRQQNLFVLFACLNAELLRSIAMFWQPQSMPCKISNCLQPNKHFYFPNFYSFLFQLIDIWQLSWIPKKMFAVFSKL